MNCISTRPLSPFLIDDTRDVRKVKCTSRTVDEDASTVTSPTQDATNARNAGTLSGSRSADSISTPKG